MFSTILILLISIAIAGGIGWLIWRKREQFAEWKSLALKRWDDPEDPLNRPSRHGRETKSEPVLDDTHLDEVIEDEFWISEVEPVELDKRAKNRRVEETAENAESRHDLIVALYVRALPERSFSGTDIFAAMERLGLQHGDMNIFHHHGLGEGAQAAAAPAPGRGKPVFSIANLTEPGSFNPDLAEDFQTPGLILFLRLPGPLDGPVAFELMLNHAHRLAEMLEGRLEDEHRQPLTPETVAFLRGGIMEFERERR